MLRRMVALTSSVLLAAGSTPFPAAAPANYAAPTANGKDETPTDRQTDVHGQSREDDDWWQFVRVLREQRRLSEVHYAVSDGNVIPLWQNPVWRMNYFSRQRQKRREQTNIVRRPARVSRDTADPPRRLTSRSGGVMVAYPTGGGFGVQVASLALSLVGSPYRWGGDTRSGFDCSGFTRYVFQQAGIVLPRTSYEQFQVGDAVAWSQLRPGDLVFFSTDSPGASHVAIYIGNGLIVQSLNRATGVIVSRLSNDYYRSRFLGARRVSLTHR